MTYCSLEEAWNLSDNEDGELEYQNFQQIDNNYFETEPKNSRERDFQNHEVEVTRKNNESQLTKMENNFNRYDQREQKNLRNVRTEPEDNMLADNSLNSNYSFLESNNVELNNQFVEEEMEPFKDTESNQVERELPSRQIDNMDLKVHEKLLINIMERLDAIDKKLSSKKEERNNVHDIVLFIVIGIFILFALDSIFRIGRLTI